MKECIIQCSWEQRAYQGAEVLRLETEDSQIQEDKTRKEEIMLEHMIDPNHRIIMEDHSGTIVKNI